MKTTCNWLLAPLCGLLLCFPLFAQSRQPNIVVIVADDLGYADLSCQGSKDIRTPRIDALSQAGVRCTSAYVTTPVGGPTRAALLTGCYPQRFGFEFNPPRDAKIEYGLPLAETTLATSLAKAGYATGLIGKWHLGRDATRQPLANGFQEFFGFLDGAHFYMESNMPARSTLPTSGPWPNGMMRGSEQVVEKEYLTDAFTREAVAFIGRQQKKPFFLMLAYNAPHAPLEVTDKHLDRVIGVTGGDHRRRSYAAMITALDDGVGAVIDKLKATGVEQDTLIIFLSDNGGITGYLSPSSNSPLIGAKSELLEGGIRVPFIVRWPGKLPTGKGYDPMVSVLDIVPTVLAAADAPHAKTRPLDGVDLTSYWSGQKSGEPHAALFWRYGPLWAVREGRFKLMIGSRKEPPQLFDLAADIGETHDLAAVQPEVVKKMKARWDQWNSELIAPTWGQANSAPSW